MPSSRVDLQSLQRLPKVELHRHLEGSMRPETLWEFHGNQGQQLHATYDECVKAVTIPVGEAPGFLPFLSRFDGLRFKYGGAEELERVAAEAVADAARDGVVHLELRFSPVFFARRMKEAAGLDEIESTRAVERAAEAIVRGAKAEATKHDISLVFIVTLARQFGLAVNLPALDLLKRPVGSSLMGLDLAGDESFSGFDFAKSFCRWKAYGRGITVHAGEDARANASQSVIEAARVLRAARIGHGIRACSDSQLMAQLAKAKVPLETCPTSNVQTQACADYATHPLKALLEANVVATINTDDPCISQTTLSREYWLAYTQCGLSWELLRTCAINAARKAFLLTNSRAALVRRVTEAWEKASKPNEGSAVMRED